MAAAVAHPRRTPKVEPAAVGEQVARLREPPSLSIQARHIHFSWDVEAAAASERCVRPGRPLKMAGILPSASAILF